MLIKRNVYFSAVDQETGEEKLFSVNELLTEDEYLERLYSNSKKEDKPKKNLIANQSSSRGNIRAGLIGGNSAVIGRAVGNHAATKAARKGANDEEVMERGKKVAGRTGAALGAAAGAGSVAYTAKQAVDAAGGVKDLGNEVKKAVGRQAKKVSQAALEKGNKKTYKIAKNIQKAVGHASGSKVGKAVVGGTVAAGAAAGALAGGLGARSGVKKAIKERKEKADVVRYGE